jgi:hypothetical protein
VKEEKSTEEKGTEIMRRKEIRKKRKHFYQPVRCPVK